MNKADRPRQLRRVWVDTDNALGHHRGDVDDGFALAALAVSHVENWSSKAESGSDGEALTGPILLGASAVSGNTDAATAARCTKLLLQEAGAGSVPVVAQVEAAEAIAAVPDGTAIVAIGPLTNVAGALEIDCRLLERTTVHIVATVQNRRRHPILPLFCLNVRHDPQAARMLFDARRSGAPGLRVLPLDVVRRLTVGRSELESLAAVSRLGSYLAHHSQRWLKQSWWRYGAGRFPVWDLPAALDALGELRNPVVEQGTLLDFDARAAWSDFLARVGSATDVADPSQGVGIDPG